MSANKICIHSDGGYNFYTLETPEKVFTIGGIPEKYSEAYIKTAASSDAVILLTAKPEFTGGFDKVLEINPYIEVYATAAGLRNIKQLVNHEVNERLIKDGMKECGLEFIITPNLSWVDSCMAVCEGMLFSGEVFSGFDGSAVSLRNEFEKRLSRNKSFALVAVECIEKRDITAIYPSYGMTMPQGTVCTSAEPQEVFAIYRKWCTVKKTEKTTAAIVYTSEYGYTQSLAQRLERRICGSVDVTLLDVNDADCDEACDLMNSSDMIIIGTDTINRSAPQKIWDAVTGIDLVNKKGTPYFVFGSYGWSGDGTKLIDKILGIMGLRRIAKPVEVILKPAADDFEKIDKAADKIISYLS